MGQEFVIKSQQLEDKINQLLPSQGGFQAGVDLSASTQIVPIVDLTESAEGSNLRQDLQSAISFIQATPFSVTNTTTTLVNTTGYFRVFGTATLVGNAADAEAIFILNDGASNKVIKKFILPATGADREVVNSYDFIVFLEAGDILQAQSSVVQSIMNGVTRQIATITGELVNP